MADVSLKLPGAARRALKSAVYTRPLNRVIRGALRPFRRLLPDRLLYRIPLVGELPIAIPGSPKFRLSIRGFDLVAMPLYWRGARGYEEAAVRTYLELLGACGAVFDVGAYVGLYAILAGLHDRGRRVFAFEPMPDIADVLLENLRLNRLSNVEVVRSAVAGRDGAADLYIPYAGLPASSSLRRGFRDARRTISVPTVSLDSFVRSRGIERVDLIKIDTETTEPEVLGGASWVVSRDAPLIICEVLLQRAADRLNTFFDRRDYAYYSITNAGAVRRSEIVADPEGKNPDHLFVPRSKLHRHASLLRRES
jgi:FkbM family methyltransferase